MKSRDVYGVGNAIVDIPVTIDHADFSQLAIPGGTSMLVGTDEQARLLQMLSQSRPLAFAAGGSVANSTVTVADLGGSAAFAGRIADDQHGLFFKGELDRLQVHFGNPFVLGGTTGTSIVLITPDGERTMRTCLGVASDLSPAELDPHVIKQSKWVFVEGYLFAAGDRAQDAIFKAIEYAKSPVKPRQAGVALTLSDTSIVRHHKDVIEKALEKADLVFANRGESMAVTGASSAHEAFEKLKLIVPNVVVTAGGDGAYILYNGNEYHVPANRVKPIDTTGAGDAFAGGFLYGVTNGHGPEESAKGGAYLASRVIMQYGARLSQGAKEAWEAGALR